MGVADDKCNQEHLTPVFLCLDQEKDTPERIAQLGTSLKSRNLHKEGASLALAFPGRVLRLQAPWRHEMLTVMATDGWLT